MKTLVIIPSIFEAKLIAVKPILHEYIKVSDKLLLTISGIGNSGIKTVKEIVKKETVKDLVLIGMCGNLSEKERMGQSYVVDSVTNKKLILPLDKKNNELIKSFLDSHNKLTPHTKPADLITVNKPVQTAERRSDLSKFAELVDMETFHYAELCKDMNLRLSAIRVVSDNCNTDLKEYFKGKEKNTIEVKRLKKAQVTIESIFNSIVKQLFLKTLQ